MISAQNRGGLNGRLASQLHEATMERVLGSHPFSCAWVGRGSELVLPSSDGVAEGDVSAHLDALHAQALNYWRIKGVELIGDDVAGYTSTYLGIRSMPRATVVGEDAENWALKIIKTSDKGRTMRVSQQIAVVGGEIVRASIVSGKTRTPMGSSDLQRLCRTMRGASNRYTKQMSK
jgi:hypothetical protein